jgi:hypothetical protein
MPGEGGKNGEGFVVTVDTAQATTAGDKTFDLPRIPAPNTSRVTRWVWAVVVAVVALVGGLTVAGLASSNGHSTSAVALGHTVRPLSVYQRVAGTTPAAGQRLVPELGHPGASTLINAKRAISLHAQYALVRTVRGRWQVQLFAPEGSTFNLGSTSGRFFVALYQGKASDLFFVEGSSDRSNFAFQTGMDRAATVAIAKALTTRVVVSG